VFWIDIDDMQISEDLHAVFGHVVMQLLCGGIKPVAIRQSQPDWTDAQTQAGH